MTPGSARHFLDLEAFSGVELRRLLDASAALKARRRKGEPRRERPLRAKGLNWGFSRRSPRTGVLSNDATAGPAGEPTL